MCDHQHRESLAPSPGCTASAQRQADAAEARLRYEQQGEEREEMGGQSLHSLHKWICELLIKNQELRMSLLDLATNQSGEANQ
jgi:hypothetical protein